MKLDSKIDYSEFLKKLKISDYKKEPWNNFKIPHGLILVHTLQKNQKL